jgi:hypothetical protein
MTVTPGYQSGKQIREMLKVITNTLAKDTSLTAKEKLKLLAERDKLAADLIRAAKVRHKIQRSKAETSGLAALMK